MSHAEGSRSMASAIAMAHARSPPSLLRLSDELLGLIASYLPRARDLNALEATCTRLQDVARDDAIWKALLTRHFFLAPNSADGAAGRDIREKGKQRAREDQDEEEEVRQLRRRMVPTNRALRDLILPGLSRTKTTRRKRSPSASADAPDTPSRPRVLAGLPPRYYRSPLLQRSASLGTAAPLGTGSSRHSLDEEATEDELISAARNQGIDWKQLYEVLYRWNQGNFTLRELVEKPASIDTGDRGHRRKRALEDANDSEDEGMLESLKPHVPEDFGYSDAEPPPYRPRTLVQTSVNLIFTADRAASRNPFVQVYLADTQPSGHSSALGFEAGAGKPSLQPILSIDSEPVSADIRARKKELRFPISGSTLHIGISELRVDSAGPTDGTLKLMVAYTSGHVVIYQISHSPQSAAATSASVYAVWCPSVLRLERKADDATVVASAFVDRLLVTCARDFRLSIFHLEASPSAAKGSLHLRQALRSFISRWPAALALQRIPVLGDASTAGAEAYKLHVAYCSPAYPASFTIGLQEIVMLLTPAALTLSDGAARSQSRFAVLSSRRATTALPRNAKTPLDTRGASVFRMQSSQSPSASSRAQRGTGTTRHWAASLPTQLGSVVRAGSSLTWGASATRAPADATPVEDKRILSIALEEPFIVVGSKDNLLEVYELIGGTRVVRDQQADSSNPESPTTRGFKLIHRGAIHGHTGAVESVALEDGRLVSGSKDGSVSVWTLEDVNHGRTRRSDARHGSSGAPSLTRSSVRSRKSDGGSVGATSTSARTAPAPLDLEHLITLMAPTPPRFAGGARAPISIAELGEDSSSDEETPFPARGTASLYPDREALQQGTLPALAAQHFARAPLHPDDRPSKRPRLANSILDLPRSVIRYVSASFDKIVSVCSLERASGQPSADETVQVWTFARA